MKKVLAMGILIIIGVFIYLVISGQGEGYWVCDKNGVWVKHGHLSYPSPAMACTNPKQLATNQADCLAAGGVWAKQGPDPVETCNRKAPDRGNLCRDNNECEGMCQVDLTDEELSQGMKGKIDINKKYGQCSVWVTELGCYGMMEKGKVGVICVD